VSGEAELALTLHSLQAHIPLEARLEQLEQTNNELREQLAHHIEDCAGYHAEAVAESIEDAAEEAVEELMHETENSEETKAEEEAETESVEEVEETPPETKHFLLRKIGKR
jgi:F0F1-type ATP synthase membrane subunit b/b'